MNANELANLLEVDSWYKLVTREEIATILRQQQAEIEALKKENRYLLGLPIINELLKQAFRGDVGGVDLLRKANK